MLWPLQAFCVPPLPFGRCDRSFFTTLDLPPFLTYLVLSILLHCSLAVQPDPLGIDMVVSSLLPQSWNWEMNLMTDIAIVDVGFMYNCTWPLLKVCLSITVTIILIMLASNISWNTYVLGAISSEKIRKLFRNKFLRQRQTRVGLKREGETYWKKNWFFPNINKYYIKTLLLLRHFSWKLL